MGLALAREAARRFPNQSIVLLEKESEPGFHASGRNSGVLHAGFYYTEESLKARFCRDGNREWKTFFEKHSLPVNPCGKLVVAQNGEELEVLELLHRRADANGVETTLLNEAQARSIEPRVKTHLQALWSPSTATVSPKQAMNALASECKASGIIILTNARVANLERKNSGITAHYSTGEATSTIEAGFVVNAAGAYADGLAHQLGFGLDLEVIPFKGLYLYAAEKAEQLKTCIYPVPNLRNPFLGVHFTVTVAGHTKIGPTAIPALWRESYGGWERFQFGEFFDSLVRNSQLFLHAGFDFRGLAIEELKKQSRSYLVQCASSLASGVQLEDYPEWGAPGIRAQLINKKTKKLEMDFRVEGDALSLHVLNSVSPAFTCAIPFSKWCWDQAQREP